MSEETKVEFASVGAYVKHLVESGQETISVAEVTETLKDIVARPVVAGQRRGQLAGLSVTEMDDEQLKREIINAKSVLYKAQQRGASIETIEKNQARVDVALEEKAKRTPVKEETPAEDVYADADTNEEVEAEL